MVDGIRSLGLVQCILYAVLEAFQVVVVKAVDEVGHPADVEAGVLPRDRRAESIPGVFCLPDEIGDKEDHLEAGGGGDSLRHPALSVVDSQLDATIDGRRNIIGVALYSRRNLEERFAPPARKLVAGQDCGENVREKEEKWR